MELNLYLFIDSRIQVKTHCTYKHGYQGHKEVFKHPKQSLIFPQMRITAVIYMPSTNVQYISGYYYAAYQVCAIS